VTLTEWLSQHRYRALHLKRFGSKVEACVAPQSSHWHAPRWKTLPADVIVTDDELAAWSRSDELVAVPRA
jgi:hypothetical protein